MNQETAMTAPATVRYFVGDLCYTMDDAWYEVCNITSYDNSEHEYELEDGRKFILFSTMYGDGTYNDDNGNPYSVDSGTIGAIKVDDIVDTDGLESAIKNGLGHIHEFPTEITGDDCFYSEGWISIHNVTINTGNEGYDDGDEDEA